MGTFIGYTPRSGGVMLPAPKIRLERYTKPVDCLDAISIGVNSFELSNPISSVAVGITPEMIARDLRLEMIYYHSGSGAKGDTHNSYNTASNFNAATGTNLLVDIYGNEPTRSGVPMLTGNVAPPLRPNKPSADNSYWRRYRLYPVLKK